MEERKQRRLFVFDGFPMPPSRRCRRRPSASSCVSPSTRTRSCGRFFASSLIRFSASSLPDAIDDVAERDQAQPFSDADMLAVLKQVANARGWSVSDQALQDEINAGVGQDPARAIPVDAEDDRAASVSPRPPAARRSAVITLSPAREQELVDALADAFTPEDLDYKVADPLKIPSAERSGARDVKERARALVKWAAVKAWTEKLVAVRLRGNPSSSSPAAVRRVDRLARRHRPNCRGRCDPRRGSLPMSRLDARSRGSAAAGLRHPSEAGSTVRRSVRISRRR